MDHLTNVLQPSCKINNAMCTLMTIIIKENLSYYNINTIFECLKKTFKYFLKEIIKKFI